MSDNNDLSLLKDLNMGMIMTGQLSEIHLKNMKTYPFIFFDNIDEIQMGFDIIVDPANVVPGSKSTVVYGIRFKDDKLPNNLQEGYENLCKCLNALFMREVRVLIKDHLGQLLIGKE